MKRCQRCRLPLVVAATGRPPMWCSPRCKQAAYRQQRKRSIHFRSESCEWSTPQEFFDQQNAIHRFTLDVCASAENTKCPVFYTREQDGLSQPWSGRCWCNPPYGKATGKWLAKAERSVRSGEAEVVVCLIFARTDTRWWHTYAKLAEVEFLQGRLCFNGENPAPFPSALLVFRNENNVPKLPPEEGDCEAELPEQEQCPCGPEENDHVTVQDAKADPGSVPDQPVGDRGGRIQSTGAGHLSCHLGKLRLQRGRTG